LSDFLDVKRSEIEERLQELRPLHDEFLRLERAKAALEGLDETERPPARPARSETSNGRRRGRRRGSGRAQEVLEIVRQNPGVTVNDLAERMGMGQKNYLYRIMAGLQGEGAVTKQGRGYVAS